jgi:hypothetical protein
MRTNRLGHGLDMWVPDFHMLLSKDNSLGVFQSSSLFTATSHVRMGFISKRLAGFFTLAHQPVTPPSSMLKQNEA